MKLICGADHRGFILKRYLMEELAAEGKYVLFDVGAFDAQRSDYPVFAHKVTAQITARRVDAGILLCGTGAGMAIAANRSSGIFAAVAWNSDVARRCKEEDNVNLLVIPADYVHESQAYDIVNAWLSATFKEGRYRKRLDAIR